MFNASIRLDQHTDVEETLRHLETQAKSSHLTLEEFGPVLQQIRVVIEEFYDRGSTLIKIGSQMRASRTIKGPGYSVSISARFGIKESIWDRILAVVRR